MTAQVPAAHSNIAGQAQAGACAKRMHIKHVNAHTRVRMMATALMIALLLVLGCTAYAHADVYDTDIIGTTAVGTDQNLKNAAPDLNCGYGALMTSDGKILWLRDADTQVPIASTTKIMTALVALEEGSLSDIITVSDNAASQDGSTAYLTAGDELSLEQMLYAMMLPSGNDAAMAIAEYYGNGSEANFAELMNAKAAQLGMASTHYSSCNGLVDDNNYSTARDYLTLISYAMKNDMFATVVGTVNYTYTSTATGGSVELTNTNTLLSDYDGATGIKTGHTDAAGYCLAASAQRWNITLYAVVFNSDSESARFSDASALLDWGYTHYHWTTLLSADTTVGEAVATDWLDKTVPVHATADVTAVVFDFDPDIVQTVTLNDHGGNIEVGANMGSVTWTLNGQTLAEVNLVASQTVASPSLFEGVGILWAKFTSIFTGDIVSVSQQIYLPGTVSPSSL